MLTEKETVAHAAGHGDEKTRKVNQDGGRSDGQAFRRNFRRKTSQLEIKRNSDGKAVGTLVNIDQI